MSSATTTPHFAPIRQAAEVNGIAYRTLLLWIARGEIQATDSAPGCCKSTSTNSPRSASPSS